MARFFLVMIGALGALSACEHTDPVYEGPPRVSQIAEGTLFAEPQNNVVLLMMPDTSYTFSLISNPTTGYYWTCTSSNQDIVRVGEKSDYVADPAPEGLVGSGGKQIFTMDAGQEGSSNLACSYQRSASDVIKTRIFIGRVNGEQAQ